jgi:hypothetical protein
MVNVISLDFGSCLIIRYQVRELSTLKYNFKKLAQFYVVAVLLLPTRNHDMPFLPFHLRLKMHFSWLKLLGLYACGSKYTIVIQL